MSTHNYDVIVSSLMTLKAKYYDAEKLMSKSNNDVINVDRLRSMLREINSEFDKLMCLTIDFKESDTVPGSISHKVDVIKSKGEIELRIESWLREVEASDLECPDVIAPEVKDDGVLVSLGKKGACKSDVMDASTVCSSSRSSNSANLRASKVKVQLAKLALKHEQERQQEATREKLRQLEMAEAELEAWETSSVSSKGISRAKSFISPRPHVGLTPSLSNKENGMRFVSDHTNVNEFDIYNLGARRSSRPCTQTIKEDTQGQVAPRPDFRPVETGDRFLPKPSIDLFDGDPLDYWSFVSRYGVHIAERVSSPDLRLAYLLQHCTKNVHDKVKHYACETNKQLAYEAVWKELYERYGQPHIISRSCEQRLSNVSKISQNDAESLENLAVLAKRCLTALKETQGPTAIDSVGFISSVANKLPNDLRRQWVSKSVKVLRHKGKVAVFSDFAEFLSTEALKTNSAYYKAMFVTSKREPSNWISKGQSFNNVTPCLKKNLRKTEIRRTGPKGSPECPCCEKSHDLLSCNDFVCKSYIDKKRVVRAKRLCFRCLKEGHMIKDCRSTKTCGESLCDSTDHHTLLHPEEPPVEDPAPVCSATSRGLSVGHAPNACLDILPVRVCCDGREVLTYALLDPGSSMTFCEPVLIKRLGLKGKGSTCETSVETLTTKRPECLKSECYSISVKPLDGSNEFEIKNVVVVEQIPVTVECRNMRYDLERFDHLRDVKLPHVHNATVTLLIGNDNYLAQFPLEVRMDSDTKASSPCAIKTPLGWVLKGPESHHSDPKPAKRGRSFLLCHSQIPDYMNGLKDSIITEDGEISPSDKGLEASDVDSLLSWLRSNAEVQEFGMRYSLEDVVSYELMNKSIKYIDGHFQLPLLWRNSGIILPDSLPMAKRRLESVKRRLNRDKKLRSKYCAEMQALLNDGYIERVPEPGEEKIAPVEKRVWYVPHHPVLNSNKPEKVRIVHDCAAQSHGTSLNENLMKGPDYINSLMGVLLRFRSGKIAIVSDIKKMFFQVRCDPDHRDALRFLWYPDGNLDLEPVKYRMKVHLFGAKSSPSCAMFALLKTAKEFGKYFDPKVASVIRENFYVDDCLVSVDDEETGKRLVEDLVDLLSRGGFHLTKWLSTCDSVLQDIPLEERAQLKGGAIDVSGGGSERVLGVKWCVKEDCFAYDVTWPEMPATRRGLLSAYSSLFDPLGLVAPVVLEARLIFRSLCQQGLAWDDPIPRIEAGRWENWKEGLCALQDVRIARCIKPYGDSQKLQLHVFADASNCARGCVCYLRIEGNDGSVKCSILAGKSLLANTRASTIPRMELEAALDAVKLAETLKRELKLCRVPCTYWTDSTIVLFSLHADCKKFGVFSRNRLSQIQRKTCVRDWRHVPTEFNPADYASRGCSANRLVRSNSWFEGPEFLKRPVNDWPKNLSLPLERENIGDQFSLPRKQALAMTTHSSAGPVGVDRLIGHFSSLGELIVATAWLLRFKQHLVDRCRGTDILQHQPIKASESQQAEIALVIYVQRKHFSAWLKKLNGIDKSKSVPNPHDLQRLNPFISNEVMRVGGRLSKASLPFEAKHPAILPRESFFTALIVKHCHSFLVGHQGLNATLSTLMQRYWITSPTSLVKRILNECLICRRRNAKPEVQMMADLPLARLAAAEPPFTHTGVDYFGPLLIKQGRSEVKRYGCLMTCMTVRAVHLELAADLTTSSFLNALRRFVARRGTVKHLYSDNGSNFVGAEKILRDNIKCWNQKQIYEYLRQQEIQWHFNPPTASHMGGAWERMVGLVKRILGVLLPRRLLNDDLLQTLLLEVEAIVNSRPLTDVVLEPGSDLPLTPNHLLRLNPCIGLPILLTGEKDLYAQQRYRVVQYIADEFWRRWIVEYPRTLFTRRKWFTRSRNVRCGDIVLLSDVSTPRGDWPLGKIVRVYPDKNGIVRIVDVKSQSGVLRRPVSKLCVIVQTESPIHELHCNKNKKSCNDGEVCSE